MQSISLVLALMICRTDVQPTTTKQNNPGVTYVAFTISNPKTPSRRSQPSAVTIKTVSYSGTMYFVLWVKTSRGEMTLVVETAKIPP